MIHTQIPEVPQELVEQEVNSTAQWVVTVAMFAAAVIITVLVLRNEKGREAKTLGVMVLIGGGLSVFFEPLGDHLGFVWHPEDGQWTAFNQYGRDIPLWIVPTYYWFIGGQTLYVLQRIRAGATKRELWHIFHWILLVDAILELPPLYADVYEYYGNQPFWSDTYFPIPVWYLVQNGLWPLICALAVLLVLELGGRRLVWAVPFAIAGATFAGYAIPAWPTWAGLNAGSGDLVMYPLNILTMILVLLTTYLVIQGIDRLTPRGESSSPATDPAGVVPDERTDALRGR